MIDLDAFGGFARSVSFWQEKLHASRQERGQLVESWLSSLEAFLRDDAALVRFGGEHRENLGEFPPDEVLGDA